MRNVLGVVLLSLIVAAGLYGQQTQLSGTVTDPTGAVVPNATITIVNIQTGVQREAKSDNQGRYTIAQIIPGTFKVTAKATGFADVVVNDVELLVNQPATIPIVFEKLGSTSTTVTVEAATVQVNTTDASLGNAISTQAITQLPFYARNVVGLLAAQPGVTNYGTFAEVVGPRTSATLADDRNGAVNGGKSDQANVTLDGVDVNDQAGRTAFTSVLRVTLDSVQEFRTTTLNGTADQGRSSGAQVALITRTGTNEFHGALYEYHRNTITAANSFFNNLSGVRRGALLINVFGGRLGGPIVKNRTFFFLNYEGRRDASAANVSRTVPSDLLRQGIVQFNNTSGQLTSVGPDQIKNVVDPLHLGPNPNVLKIFNQYPHGNDNTLGDGLNFIGFRFTAPVKGDQNTYIARFDHQLTSDGKHQLYFRGNLQNDSANGTPQFPGAQPNSVGLANNKGLAAGWTAVLKPNLISTFRYGFTRVGGDLTGIQSASAVTFRGLNAISGLSDGFSQIIPVHNITQDFAYTKNAHDIRFGGVLRFITNGTTNFGHSFLSASTNASWLRGTGDDITPASLGVSSKDAVAYADAMVALLGIVTQGNANYNYDTAGNVSPVGAPVLRKYANQEYEMYGQDTWKLTRNLTVSYGLRYSLTPPVYEVNNQQISSNISLENFFNTRGGLADSGKSQSGAGSITYILANGPGGRPLYPYHKKDFAPRFSVAYSPKAEGGLSKLLFGGPGKTSIRAGWGMFYDLVGQPLAATGDASAFGLSTTLVNPAGVQTSATAPRFTDFLGIPSQLVRPPGKGGFPVPQPSSGPGSFAITNTIDDTLKIPYAMNMNFTVGREFGKGLYIQGSYVGRLSRRSLVNRDLAMPTNLKDPKSGQTYFEAASQLAGFLINARNNGVSKAAAVAATPKIPFFENLWAPAAGNGLTATQVIAQEALFNGSPQDFTTALADFDAFCNPGSSTFFGGIVDTPGCSILGPNAIFNPQFSSLSAWSSIGGGSYHAMQWTVRKRFSEGLLFDLNYTYSKSVDLASRAENAGSFAGFIINAWNPGQRKAVSDYDTTHSVNAHTVWELPFGHGRRFAGGSNRVVDAIIGGWQFAGSWSMSSGLPTSPGNGRRWPTNWNITGFATPNGAPQPEITNNKNAPAISGKGGPNLWSDPKSALASFGFTLPGQAGTRNTLRGQGAFVINTGLSKRWVMPYSEHHAVQLRWETFNLTNTTRFDPQSVNLSLTSTSNWGKYTTTLSQPRQMQFALRYEF